MLNHSSASGELPAHKVFALMLGAAIANEQHTFKLLSQQALKTLNANCGFTDEQRERLQKTLAQMTTVDGAVDSDIDEEQVTAPRGRKKEQAE